MLIIEDGTGKPDAESYATAEDLERYAMRFGSTIPPDETAREALLRRASLAMDGMKWKGRKSSTDQALAWPRRGVHLDQENKPPNYLPARIPYGQMALAVEIHADDLDPADQRKGPVVRERIDGAVEREFAVLGNNSGRLLPAAPDRPSATQFADYLERRVLSVVRA